MFLDYDALHIPDKEDEDDFPTVSPFEEKGGSSFAGTGPSFPHLIPSDEEEADEEFPSPPAA